MATTTQTGITELNVVIVAVSDSDRAVEFYEGLGLEKRVDVPFGDGNRWIEVYPPNGTAGIALCPPGPDGQIGGQTGISLSTHDIDATHASLRAQGVDVDDEVSRMGDPVPPLCWFRDPDGNTLMLVEVPAA
jgi:catechol 2,3-dioxygenase-like lactoylglutathione lyase family enzyme